MSVYRRWVRSLTEPYQLAVIDIYSVLDAYPVPNAAAGHACKKLLMAGERGSKNKMTDLREALAAVQRAIELEESK